MKYLRIFWSKQRVFFCFPELSVTLIALTVTHCLPMYKIRKLKCHLRTCRSSYRKEEKFLHPVCKWTSILIGVRCITSLLHGQQSYHSYYRDFFFHKILYMEKWFNERRMWLFGNNVPLLPRRYVNLEFFLAFIPVLFFWNEKMRWESKLSFYIFLSLCC